MGRSAPELKKIVVIDGEPQKDYDLAAILRHHLTPGLMSEREDLPIRNAKNIGCGAYHSFVITLGDVVHSCGLNNYGQLGLGQGVGPQQAWLCRVRALDGKSIVEAKGGMHHSLALSARGSLFAFGRSDSGQLGFSDGKSRAGDYSSEPGASVNKPLLLRCR